MWAPITVSSPPLPVTASQREENARYVGITPVSPEVTGRCLLLPVTDTQTQTEVVNQCELVEKFPFLSGLRSVLFPYLRPRKRSTCSAAEMPLAHMCTCLCGRVEVPRTKGELGNLLALDIRGFLNVPC